jgi:hypothetical protein
MPTSAESQRQLLQYRKNGGSPTAFTGAEFRPSSAIGGSEGTTASVLRQLGHWKQLRAHLFRVKDLCMDIKHPRVAHLFFSARTLALGTSKRQLGQ